MIVIRNLVLILVTVLLASSAWAQDAMPEDDVLQRYALATENLDAAVAALPTDAAAARASLDQAFSALLTLSRGGNTTLNASIDRVFERARVAIENRSVTDLSVQAEVLRGGFQRLLYEAALTAAVEGDDAFARERLLRLATDVGLGSARIETLRAATGVGSLRRTFEAGVAEQTSARLTALAAQDAAAEPDAAYRAFADAYGDYLLVQDSPRLSAETNRLFVEAANAVVDGDASTFTANLQAVAGELEALREAADAGATDALAEAPAAPGDEAAPEAAPGADAPASEAAELPLQDAEAAAPEGTPGDGVAGPEAADDVSAADAAAVDEEAVRAAIEAEAAAERRDALIAELGGLGVPEAERDTLADALTAAGVSRVEEAETALAALSSRLGVHVLRGEVGAARARLADVDRTYRATLQPVTTAAAPEADASLTDLLARLDAAPALRNEDAALLASELEAVGEALRDGTSSTAHEVVATVSSWWAGWIRPAAMIVLALLAIVPMRLLDTAFGGGNRNWRIIGLALFLLLLPVMYEGVAAAAALLARPLDLPVLQELTTWSMFQNDVTQMAWAALTLLALVLASIGFYGICVQFGVLGRGRAAAPGPAPSTSRDDTLVDWDDDF